MLPTDLAIFSPLDPHHAVVNPQLGERLTTRGERLGGLVLVVGEDQIRAATVDLEPEPEQSARAIAEHSMCQPGRPAAPGGVPARVLARLVRLPEGEVERIALAIRSLDALALIHLIDVAMGYLAVFRVAAHRKVDVSVGRIRVPALDQPTRSDWTISADRLARPAARRRGVRARARRCRRCRRSSSRGPSSALGIPSAWQRGRIDLVVDVGNVCHER